MRVMMSTDTRRYDGHGDAAMREARRILSVAEPESVQPIRTVCHEPAHVWAHRGAYAWLAESLSAFVAADDPAEYLAAMGAR